MSERRAPWRLLADLHRRRGEATQAQLREALHELQSLEDSLQGCAQQQALLLQRCGDRAQQQAQLSAAPRMCIASWLDGERHREELDRQLRGAEQALERAQQACDAQQAQLAQVRARLARHTRQAQQYQARADRLERQRAEQRELAEDEEIAETIVARARLDAGERARRE
ncbi:type III secretory pathway component [Xanthomonas hyacinthi]|uniref:Type III secretory pathway component n=1 Tax=Xanthomonas hyacinthi TaxID=56455 RepID=A0A2S7ERC1_9XANT|nr:type III secretory pathway component [Xanthomonas hyacinthi]KLD76643.1 type III secretory pathway component [Xanthomonas hyacinthi DSM 19077]PPU95668.1 type III secretory pathway component [Xanthomonas hyacinthi]QGY78079.1 type III secretory pathway component [Xanthomonas hyacinthi]